MEHHALVECEHAKELWEAMAEHWELPPACDLKFTGPEWLLQVLAKLEAHRGALVELICWRIWYVRNELEHNKHYIPCSVSVDFLKTYLTELLNAQRVSDGLDKKMKSAAVLTLGGKTKKKDPADQR